MRKHNYYLKQRVTSCGTIQHIWDLRDSFSYYYDSHNIATFYNYSVACLVLMILANDNLTESLKFYESLETKQNFVSADTIITKVYSK